MDIESWVCQYLNRVCGKIRDLRTQTEIKHAYMLWIVKPSNVARRPMPLRTSGRYSPIARTTCNILYTLQGHMDGYPEVVRYDQAVLENWPHSRSASLFVLSI